MRPSKLLVFAPYNGWCICGEQALAYRIIGPIARARNMRLLGGMLEVAPACLQPHIVPLEFLG
jgi:hypothetical protein